MAEKRPNISPSEQILPGGFNLDVASGDTSAMSKLKPPGSICSDGLILGLFSAIFIFYF